MLLLPLIWIFSTSPFLWNMIQDPSLHFHPTREGKEETEMKSPISGFMMAGQVGTST